MPRALIRIPAFTTAAPVARPNPAAPRTDRAVRRFVTGIWFVSFALLLAYAARTATRIPLLDEICNVCLLENPFAVSPATYWTQHNEHRIPLPKFLFVAAVKLAGNDFRAPPLMNAVLLAAAAAVLTHAVAAGRGRWAVTDATIPLAVMTLGQWENLFWGFQVQFISSTALALVFLASVVRPGLTRSPRRVAGAGAATLLLPLCGANGVALTPALSCFFLALGAWSLARGRRAVGITALALGVTGFALVVAYFVGLEPSGHHTVSHSPAVIARNAVNFVGVGFGSVVLTVHGPGGGVAGYAVGMVVLLILTAGLLIHALRAPGRRAAAVGIGCLIGGVLCLGLGLAYGRGAMQGVLASNRYTTLAMPLVAAVYAAWAVIPTRLGRVVTYLLFGVVVAGWVPNAREAVAAGSFWRERQTRVEAEIRAGIPTTFVLDRHFPDTNRDFHRLTYLSLRRQGFVPFDRLVPDPEWEEMPVALRVTRVEGMEVKDGWFRASGPTGHVVLALPDRRYVYGLKLTYETESPRPLSVTTLLSWEPGGTYPPRPGYGIIDNLYPTAGPATAYVFVDRETDLLRIDLGDPGAAVRVHGLSVVTRRE